MPSKGALSTYTLSEREEDADNHVDYRPLSLREMPTNPSRYGHYPCEKRQLSPTV